MASLPVVLGLIGGIGTGEIIFILVLIILLFGVNKIPELARSLGKAQREFQKARQDAENEVESKPPPAALATEDEKVRQAAKDLGIATEGKSLDEVKAAIAKKMQG